jgi:cytochrome c oxidase assembly protein subunit 15
MKAFQRILLLCIVGTYLVILAGAVVRGTGSGLGCPDWPRCFGRWVPPMDISELPENYKEVYKIAGKTIADFDPFKTWTEYINRLLGVILGFLVTLLFIFSFKVKQYEHNIPWFTGGLLLLIIIQGGVGALVVSTHLKPYLITIHMFLALIMLFGLLYLNKYCKDLEDTNIVQPVDPKSLFLGRLLVGFTFVQILMGTQVRQSVDHLIRDTGLATHATVMEMISGIFYVHRSFTLIILGLFFYLLFHLQQVRYNRSAFFLCLSAFFCACGNVVTGMTLNYMGFPANFQPPHLFFGIMTIGLLYQLTLNLRGSLLDD